jgi:tetratricopeptide (TPR) repeat protein
MELIRHALFDGDIALWVDVFAQVLRSWNNELCYRLLRIAKQVSEDSYAKCIVKRWEGKYWLQFGEWDSAIRALQSALDGLPVEMRQQRIYLNLMGELGQAYRWLGNYEQAEQFYKRGLAVSIERDDRSAIAQMRSNLGVVARIQGRINEAVNCFNQSLQYYEEVGDVERQIRSLNNLGVIYKNLSNWERATVCYERAIALTESSDDRRALGVLLANLGNCLYPQGKWDEAHTEYEKALTVFVELGDPTGIIRALNGLGIVCGYKEQWGQAEKYYRQSAEHARGLNDTLGWADALDNLGIALARQGRFEEAEDCYRRSLQLYKSMDHLAGSEHVLNNWGRLWEERGEFTKAIEHYQQCVQIDQQLGAKWDELDARINLARALARDDRGSEARATLDYVIAESQSCGFSDHQAWALKERGDLFLLTGEVDLSLEAYKRALLVATSVNPYLPQQVISAIKKVATSMMQPPDRLTAWLRDVQSEDGGEC